MAGRAAPGPAYRAGPAARPDAEVPRAAGSVGEVCRALAALASATVACRDAGGTAGRPTAPRAALAGPRADAQAAVGRLVRRLGAGDAPLERVLVVVRSAVRDALPGSLSPAEARALAADAVRWAIEAYPAG